MIFWKINCRLLYKQNTSQIKLLLFFYLLSNFQFSIRHSFISILFFKFLSFKTFIEWRLLHILCCLLRAFLSLDSLSIKHSLIYSHFFPKRNCKKSLIMTFLRLSEEKIQEFPLIASTSFLPQHNQLLEIAHVLLLLVVLCLLLLLFCRSTISF